MLITFNNFVPFFTLIIFHLMWMKWMIIHLLFVIFVLTYLSPVSWSASALTIVPYILMCFSPAITVTSYQPWCLWCATQHPVLICGYSLQSLVLLCILWTMLSSPEACHPCLHAWDTVSAPPSLFSPGTVIQEQRGTCWLATCWSRLCSKTTIYGEIPCSYTGFTFLTFSITKISSLDRSSIAPVNTASDS